MGLVRKTKYFGVSFYAVRISFNSLDSIIVIAFERALLNQPSMNGKEKKRAKYSFLEHQ